VERPCFSACNLLTPYTFPMLDGEEKLIKSAVKGNSSAFGSLYDHYQPMIYRFIAIKVSRREEAEDITHQVFFVSVAEYSFVRASRISVFQLVVPDRA
jgi:hypothetical protein